MASGPKTKNCTHETPTCTTQSSDSVNSDIDELSIPNEIVAKKRRGKRHHGKQNETDLGNEVIKVELTNKVDEMKCTIKELENQKEELQQQVQCLIGERDSLNDNSGPKLKEENRILQNECEMLKKDLKEVKALCKFKETICSELSNEKDKITSERNVLKDEIEHNQKLFDAKLSQEKRKLNEQVDDLLKERIALFQRIDSLEAQLSKKDKVASVGTQCDFSLDLRPTGRERLDSDNRSTASKSSAISVGSMSSMSEISVLTGSTDDTRTIRSSDTRSIKRHASRVLSMAKKTISGSSRKNEVYPDLPSSRTPTENNKLGANKPPKYMSYKSQLPPPAPRPKLVSVEKTTINMPMNGNANISNVPHSSTKAKMKEKLFKNKLSRKSSQSSKKLFAGTPDDLEFYLPKVALDGSKTQENILVGNITSKEDADDPTSLANILRPWQVEFLESMKITTASQLVFASKCKSSTIAKAMVKWRSEKKMKTMKTKACAVALHIWTRTIEAEIRTCFMERSGSGSGSGNNATNGSTEDSNNKSTIIANNPNYALGSKTKI